MTDSLTREKTTTLFRSLRTPFSGVLADNVIHTIIIYMSMDVHMYTYEYMYIPVAVHIEDLTRGESVSHGNLVAVV